jgi:hypothetical protein
MEKSKYPDAEQREDRAYIIKKLGLSEDEFERLLNMPHKTFRDYPSNAKLYAKLFKLRAFLSRSK